MIPPSGQTQIARQRLRCSVHGYTLVASSPHSSTARLAQSSERQIGVRDDQDHAAQPERMALTGPPAEGTRMSLGEIACGAAMKSG